MKTFKVKNYKGNLVESLKRFSDLYKGMKIVEAIEEKDTLKIKVQESTQEYKLYELYFDHGYDKVVIKGVRKPSLEEAQKFWLETSDEPDPDSIVTGVDEISLEDACEEYDMTDLDEWETFGVGEYNY